MRSYITKQGDMWDSIAHSQLGDVMHTDKLMNLNIAYGKYDAIRAAPVESDKGGNGSPVINIQYDITGVGSVNELEAMLKGRDDDLIGVIIEALDERDGDRSRRAYK